MRGLGELDLVGLDFSGLALSGLSSPSAVVVVVAVVWMLVDVGWLGLKSG